MVVLGLASPGAENALEIEPRWSGPETGGEVGAEAGVGPGPDSLLFTLQGLP